MTTKQTLIKKVMETHGMAKIISGLEGFEGIRLIDTVSDIVMKGRMVDTGGFNYFKMKGILGYIGIESNIERNFKADNRYVKFVYEMNKEWYFTIFMSARNKDFYMEILNAYNISMDGLEQV